MKIIQKITYSFLCISLLISCETTELTDLLDNPNGVSPDKIDVNLGTNGIQIALAEMFEDAQEVGGQATRMNYMFGSTYQAALAPDTAVQAWNNAYAGVLNDAQIILPKAIEFGAGYQEGIIRICKAYALLTLVDFWGDVPYTEALQGVANFNPKLTDGETVYAAAINELDLAIAAIETDFSDIEEDLNNVDPDARPTNFDDANSIPGGGSPANFFFKNVDNDILVAIQWLKVANSLKFKAFLNTANVAGMNAILADATLNVVLPQLPVPVDLTNILATDGDLNTNLFKNNFAFTYGNSNNPESRHPLYIRDYGDGVPNDYMSNSYMFAMVSRASGGGNPYESGGQPISDPRWPYYFNRQVLAFPGTEDNPSLGDALPCADDASPYGPNEAFCSFGPGFWGRDHGDASGIPPDGNLRTVYGAYPIGGAKDSNSDNDIDDGDGASGAGIAPIFMAFHMDLLRAEAALRYGTTDNDALLLSTAIDYSTGYVTTFNGDGATSPIPYRNAVMADYNSASTDRKLQIIGEQMWFASFGNGVEMYNMYRRTGKPDNLQRHLLLDGGGAFARSLFYPTSTANLNLEVPQKANLTQSVFWANESITLQ